MFAAPSEYEVFFFSTAPVEQPSVERCIQMYPHLNSNREENATAQEALRA